MAEPGGELAAHAPQLTPRAQVHSSPSSTVQMLSMVQPIGKLTDLTWSRKWTSQIMDGPDFFLNSTAPEQCSARKSWPYFYAPLQDMPEALTADLGVLSQLGSPFRPIKQVVNYCLPVCLGAATQWRTNLQS